MSDNKMQNRIGMFAEINWKKLEQLGFISLSEFQQQVQAVSEAELLKASEQMDQMSENYGKRPIEEVREIYRHQIKESLIILNSLLWYGNISESDYQQGKDRLKKLADEYNIEDFENLPTQQTVDILELERQKEGDNLAEIFSNILNDAGFRIL